MSAPEAALENFLARHADAVACEITRWMSANPAHDNELAALLSQDAGTGAARVDVDNLRVVLANWRSTGDTYVDTSLRHALRMHLGPLRPGAVRVRIVVAEPSGNFGVKLAAVERVPLSRGGVS